MPKIFIPETEKNCQSIDIKSVKSIESYSDLNTMTFPTHIPPLPGNLKQHTFSRCDLIPIQSNVLLRIERGAVRSVTWSEEGTTLTLGYWGAGDVLGQPLSSVQPYQIQCKTRVEASYISSTHWAQALDGIFRHNQQVEELFCIVRCGQVSLRLQQLLIWLARKFGRKIEQGQLIDLRLTHQEIAEVISTTRVTVTRLLSQFEQEGLIYRPRRHLIALCKK